MYNSIKNTYKNIKVKIRPKWDWNYFLLLFLFYHIHVKIRPKWDWNHKFLCSPHPLFSLKSDQNGIEIILKELYYELEWVVKIRPKWDWNAFPSQNILFFMSVKIRPKWDWNLMLTISFSPHFFLLKSDQNGIEIRVCIRIIAPSGSVKIRPKWDWNVLILYFCRYSLCYCVKIRPKWDWN